MSLEGKIKTYNEERGFGFIQIDGEKKDLFFHIKDMPNKEIQPKVGELLKFRIVEENGKLKADNITRLDVKIESVRHTPQSRASQEHPVRSYSSPVRRPKKQSNWFTSIAVLVIIGLGITIYQKMNTPQESESLQVQNVVSSPQPQQNFSCDGREHCSQMRSYEEAVYFNQHCPNTKMDGDGDGIPCESQFNRY